MTEPTKPSGTSGSDDPWEQLAEDLFGLDFGKEHAAAMDVPAAETSVPPPAGAASPPVPVAPVHEKVEGPAVRSEVVEAQIALPEHREPMLDQGGPAVHPATPSPQDSYWDALANWNWGEGEGPAARSKPSEPRHGESQRVGGSKTREAARTTDRSGPAPSEARTESSRSLPAEGVETGDFGLGIAPTTSDRGPSTPVETPKDRVAAHASAIESDDDEGEEEEEDDSSVAESTEAETADAGDEGAPRKRRRRRRRRRSRNGNEPAGASSSAGESPVKVPGADWDQPVPPPSAPRGDERPRRPPGEGQPQTERADDRSRSSRNRRGERRGPPSPIAEQVNLPPDDDFETESLLDEVTTVGGGDAGVDFAADDENGDSGDSFVNFADVPTWEEAISYLLHPNQVQVDANGGSEESSGEGRPGDQPRQTRHYGGRRR